MPIYHFVFNVIGDLFGFGFVFAKCELRKECDFKILSNEGRTFGTLQLTVGIYVTHRLTLTRFRNS